jgi:RIO kinase 2
VEMVLRFARVGLIHGDFNEFNVLVKEEEVDVEAESASHQSAKDDTADSTAQSASQPEPQIPTPPTDPIPTPKTRIKLTPIVIDFPQTLSIDHPNGPFYFARDITCIKRFFERRFHFTSNEPGPFFEDAVKALRTNVGKGAEEGAESGTGRLDVEVEASGFSRKMARELEGYMKEVGVDGDAGGGGRGSDEEEGEDDGDDDDDEGEEDENEIKADEQGGKHDIDEDSSVDQMRDLKIQPETAETEQIR